MTASAQCYLSFRLGDEFFAIRVERVFEILEVPRITKVPRTPTYMRGVINLRGNVLPVIDTAAKFGMPHVADTVDTCIMVLNIRMENEEVTLGAVVDSVQEVLEILPDQVQPAPSIGSKFKSEFIEGMVKIKEQFIMLLNLDRAFSTEEIITVKSSGTEETLVP